MNISTIVEAIRRVWRILVALVRELNPVHQLEHGPAFLLYVGAVICTAAGLFLLGFRHGRAGQALLLALILWVLVVAGDALILLMDPTSCGSLHEEDLHKDRSDDRTS